MANITEAQKEWELRKQWFISRIGKTVYRNKTSCDCNICKIVYEKGLLLTDQMHAEYAHDCESIFTAEGHPLRYFDTIEERDGFEKGLPKKEASEKTKPLETKI